VSTGLATLDSREAAHAWLERLLKPDGAAPRPPEEQPEMDTLMQEIISDAVRRHGKPVSLMSKEERIQAVQAMMQRGLFIVKGGVDRAASALAVSRFTIYNYLEALRERDGIPPVAKPRKPALRTR